MDTFKLYLAGKIVNVNEGKMKDLAMKIDRVASNMRKDRMMKPFADKFKKDAMKSMNIRKSLEKVLPDYVAGKTLDKVMKEDLDEVAMGRVKNKPLAPIPALTKANIKHSHNQSAFKKNKTMVGVSDKDYDKAKKIVGNMPNVMLHTEAVNEMHCKDCGCEKGNIRPDCDCPNNGSAPATAEHWVSSTNEAISLSRMKLIGKIAKHGSPKVKSALKAPSRVDNKDKNKNEGLWDNIRKKKARIAKGSGEKMRSKGDKGAPTPDQIKRASEGLEEVNERNYRKEYDNYQGKPEQIANRSSRNSARRIMGDKAVKGMDVGHKDNNPLNNNPKNLQMEDPSENRREPRTREVEEKATDKRMRSWHKDYDFDQDRDIVKGFVSPKAKSMAKKIVKDAIPMNKAIQKIRSKFPGMKMDAVSDLLKKEGLPQALKAKDSARRKEYNAFQKARRK